MNVNCPHCKKSFSYYDSVFRPFCSERCRMVDLGVWLDEGYRVPASALEIEDEEKIENENEIDES